MSARLSNVLRCVLVGAVSAGGALALAGPASASPVSTGDHRPVRVDTGMAVALTNTQLYWARRIIAVVRKYPRLFTEDQRKRAADIALMTALTESALFMYANSNNPESLRLPHDRVGSDHGSVGLFQQQVGGAINSTADWGSTAQCMDVEYSTRAFLDRLTEFDWTNYSNWAAAQRVQGSFDPTGGNYQRNDSLAIATRMALWDATRSAGAIAVKLDARPEATSSPTAHGVIASHRVQLGDNLTQIAARLPSRVTVASLAKLNHLKDPDLIYVGQVLRTG